MSLAVSQCALVTTSVVVGDSVSPILQLPWICVEYIFGNIETCDQRSPCYYPCLNHLCDFIVVRRQKMTDHLYYQTRDLHFPAHVYRLVARFCRVNQVETPQYYDHTIELASSRECLRESNRILPFSRTPSADPDSSSNMFSASFLRDAVGFPQEEVCTVKRLGQCQYRVHLVLCASGFPTLPIGV